MIAAAEFAEISERHDGLTRAASAVAESARILRSRLTAALGSGGTLGRAADGSAPTDYDPDSERAVREAWADYRALCHERVTLEREAASLALKLCEPLEWDSEFSAETEDCDGCEIPPAPLWGEVMSVAAPETRYATRRLSVAVAPPVALAEPVPVVPLSVRARAVAAWLLPRAPVAAVAVWSLLCALAILTVTMIGLAAEAARLVTELAAGAAVRIQRARGELSAAREEIG